MRETILKCPITGQRHKITEEDGAPTILDVEEGMDLPVGWGEIIVRRVIANPSYAAAISARNEKAQLLLAQIDAAVAATGASEEEADRARATIPAQVEREHPLPGEYATAEWAYSSVSPGGMDEVDAELSKIGLVLTPVEAPEIAEAE